MTVADQIYALVQTLPEEQASEVLTFVELVRSKQTGGEQAKDAVDPEVSRMDAMSWPELINHLAGAWEDNSSAV